jgi:hypothetical protein
MAGSFARFKKDMEQIPDLDLTTTLIWLKNNTWSGGFQRYIRTLIKWTRNTFGTEKCLVLALSHLGTTTWDVDDVKRELDYAKKNQYNLRANILSNWLDANGVTM